MVMRMYVREWFSERASLGSREMFRRGSRREARDIRYEECYIVPGQQRRPRLSSERTEPEVAAAEIGGKPSSRSLVSWFCRCEFGAL